MSAARILRAAVLALLLAAAEFALLRSHWGQQIEYRLLDGWFALRGPIAPPDDIAVIALDEESYRNLGVPLNAPWPRQLHAKLLAKLAKAGARAVAFDVLFLGPVNPDSDSALAAGFRGIPSTIGAELGLVKDGDYTQESVLLPYEEFRPVTTAGLVGIPLTEGTARAIPQNESEIAPDLPSLPLALIRRINPAAQPAPPGSLINFFGPARSIRTFSYYQILDETVPFPAAELAGKIVFVGLSLRTGTGADKKDAYLTSFPKRGLTYGVEIQATIAANLRDRSWIESLERSQARWLAAVCTAIVGTILLLIPPLWGGAALILSSALWLGTGYYLFRTGLFIPAATGPLIVLPAAFLIETLEYYVRVRKERRKLLTAFEHYISPEMAREVAAKSGTLELGGELVTATALFTDIEGFTQLSEKMAPGETAAMLNSYFTEVMEAIFQKRGTLIKFIGDAVFALWGAPVKMEEHAQKAFEAAFAIMHEVERFNESGRFPRLHTRIGLNTGAMLVGNLGAAKRFDFTAIGDAVNLASRVEGMNKYLGTTLLMTENTYDGLAKKEGIIPFGRFKVSGKAESIPLYGIFNEPPAAGEVVKFAEAVRLYQSGEFTAAKAALNALCTGKFETAAKLYLESLPDSLPGSWDGSIRLESK